MRFSLISALVIALFIGTGCSSEPGLRTAAKWNQGPSLEISLGKYGLAVPDPIMRGAETQNVQTAKSIATLEAKTAAIEAKSAEVAEALKNPMLSDAARSELQVIRDRMDDALDQAGQASAFAVEAKRRADEARAAAGGNPSVDIPTQGGISAAVMAIGGWALSYFSRKRKIAEAAALERKMKEIADASKKELDDADYTAEDIVAIAKAKALAVEAAKAVV